MQEYILNYLMYCCSLFYYRLALRTNVLQINQLQRRVCQMISRAYKTISLDAVHVLTTSPPWDLKIQLRSIQYLLGQKIQVTNWSTFPPLDTFIEPSCNLTIEHQTRKQYTKTIHNAQKQQWESSPSFNCSSTIHFAVI